MRYAYLNNSNPDSFGSRGGVTHRHYGDEYELEIGQNQNASSELLALCVYSDEIMEFLENYREMSASLIDIYLSSANHRLGDTMRVLTVIATIFIPLTFIVGLYGMNFSHPNSPWAMPELHWYYGYPIVLGIMLATVIAMLLYFRRKKWF